MFTDIGPGVQLVEQFGKLKTGIWLFHNGTECAIMEMPDLTPVDPVADPWRVIAQNIEARKLKVKFMTVSHNHSDHFNCYPQFHRQFPHVPLIVNPKFFKDVHITKFLANPSLNQIPATDASVVVEGVPMFCYNEDIFETTIAGEPFFIFHAPKHSWSDNLVLFRGCLITSDWWLGIGDPNPNHIPIPVINKSISMLEEFCAHRNYEIKNVFSVHANEFRRDIDFYALMESTRPN